MPVSKFFKFFFTCFWVSYAEKSVPDDKKTHRLLLLGCLQLEFEYQKIKSDTKKWKNTGLIVFIIVLAVIKTEN